MSYAACYRCADACCDGPVLPLPEHQPSNPDYVDAPYVVHFAGHVPAPPRGTLVGVAIDVATGKCYRWDPQQALWIWESDATPADFVV